MDLRIQKTRTSIINAFIQLRAKKQLEKITVKELADIALINKSTFYLHFKDIYDLSDVLENEMIQSVLHAIPHPESFMFLPYSGVKELIRAFTSQGQLFHILFSEDRTGVFASKMEKELKTFIFQAHPEYQNNPKMDILLSMLIYGSFYAYNNLQYEESILVDTLAEITSQLVTTLESPASAPS